MWIDTRAESGKELRSLALVVVSVQFSHSAVSDSLQPHRLQQTRPPCPSPTPKVYSNSSIQLVMPSNHLVLCHPHLLPAEIFPRIRVFSNESVLRIRWPKYWSFSFSISLSNEHPGLISFRMDLLDLLAVQGTVKSLLQHHSSRVPILWRSAFFIIQLSHPYMTTGKTIALTSGLNYFNGAFLLGFLWRIILICLVPSPYLAYLRILP